MKLKFVKWYSKRILILRKHLGTAKTVLILFLTAFLLGYITRIILDFFFEYSYFYMLSVIFLFPVWVHLIYLLGEFIKKRNKK